MITRTFADLVQDLRQRREVGDPPPVLLLGAGASVESGIGAMSDLFAFVQCKDFTEFCTYITPLNANERYRLLSRFLQTRQPEQVTPGYRGLAALAADAYFDIILTTNLDPLLDDALAAARLWRKDYSLLVNGVVRTDRLELIMTARSPRVKIIKLHGDLFMRFMAWTPVEMDNYVSTIAPQVKPIIQGRDVLVVGHSLRDDRIRELAFGAGGAIWYMNYAAANAAPRPLPDFLTNDDRVRIVTGTDSAFEKIFTGLANTLGAMVQPSSTATPQAPSPAARRGERPSPEAKSGGIDVSGGSVSTGGDIVGGDKVTHGDSVTGDKITIGNVSVGAAVAAGRGANAHAATVRIAQTVDDFMTAVVALATDDGQRIATGFVLADPYLLIADGYTYQSAFKQQKQVTIITTDGQQLVAEVIRSIAEHPFGPLILRVPADLRVSGLRLDTRRLTARLAVRVGVTAGERVGISAGIITSGKDESVAMQDLGAVKQLVAIEARVAPGACGAPVVDDTFAVRGFIVAGSDQVPQAYMYPAARWADALA